MKKTILVIFTYICFLSVTIGQSVVLFKGSTNLLTPLYNGGGNTNTIAEVTTGSPYEGTSHFELTFPTSSFEYNAFSINGGSGVNLSSMTYLVIAYKGSNNPVTDSLQFYLKGGGVSGSTKKLAINTPAYKVDTIPLSVLTMGSSINLSNVTEIYILLENISSGNFYIDNVHAISESTTGILHESKEMLSVFPNPSQGEFKINSPLLFSDYKVTVANVMGKTVYQGEFSENISLSHLPKGIYLMKLDNGKGYAIKQILIQ